jgi:hypothetical protein
MSMTEEAAAAGQAEEDRTTVERWTFAGQAPGRKRAVIEVWWDARGERLAYAPAKGFHGVPGGLYEVRVYRDPEGKTITRYGGATFVGADHDGERRMRAEAEAAAGARELSRDRLERRAKGGALGEVLGEVRSAAATMTHAQREAFLAMLAREVYTARRADR